MLCSCQFYFRPSHGPRIGLSLQGELEKLRVQLRALKQDKAERDAALVSAVIQLSLSDAGTSKTFPVKPPSNFLCPITMEIMKDPVIIEASALLLAISVF